MLNSRYLLGRVLGQGGYGITYLAWDLTFEAKRAIKEYFPRSICTRGKDERTVRLSNQRESDFFEYGVKKFVEEAKALERLREHPTIVKCFDFFRENGTAYLVMELMDGRTLLEFLGDQGGSISFDVAASILVPVMDALREVHRTGMLHRDVAPDNIFITNNRQVKLFDFGSTRLAVREHTQNLGDHKPGYTAMEVYSGGSNQGHCTDIYSLGATFYRALTGQPPPPALDRLDNDTLVPPSRFGVGIDSRHEAALLKALAVRPIARFQTVEEFQKIFLPTVKDPGKIPHGNESAWLFRLGLAVLGLLLALFAVAFGLYENNSTNNAPQKVPVASSPPTRSEPVNPRPAPASDSRIEGTIREKITQGDAYMKRFQYEDAIRSYGEARELHPADPTLQSRIKTSLDSAQKMLDAEKSVLGAGLTPSSAREAETENGLSRAKQEFDQGNYQAAIADYKKILSREPTNREAQAGLQRAITAERAEKLIR